MHRKQNEYFKRSAALAPVLLLLVAKVFLDYAYIWHLSPIYSYAGYYEELSFGRLITSYALVFLLAIVSPLRNQKPSSVFAFLYLFTLVVPLLSLWALRQDDTTFMCLMLGSYLILLAGLRVPTFNPRLTIRNSWMILISLFALLLTAVMATAWLRGGFELITFDPRRIYEVREQVTSSVFSAGLAGYSKEWFGKVVCPALMILSLHKRRYFAFVLLSSVQLLFFGLTAAKDYFVFPVLAVVTYFILYQKRRVVVVLPAIILALFLVSLEFSLYVDDFTAVGIVMMRPFFTLGHIAYEYYYFFESHPHTFLSNTAIGFLVEYPFEETVSRLVGADFWGQGRDANANVGIFASGYMHFGAIGMFTFAFLLAVVLRLYDSLIVGRIPLEVGIPVAMTPALQFVNGDFTATLVSHGVGLSFVVLLLIGGKDKKSASNKRPVRRWSPSYPVPHNSA